MISFPSVGVTPPPIFSVYHTLSIGNEMRQVAGAPGAAIAWATANQARYIPFNVGVPFVVRKLLVYCGTTGGGNIDMGLYDDAGGEVISIAAAAHPASTGWKEFDVTDTYIQPGLYYIGLLCTVGTATFLAWANKEAGRAAGVFSQAVGAGTLPSPTATFAALDAAVVPIVAMSSRDLI